MTGWTRLLGGILSFAILDTPGPALSAIVPLGTSVTVVWDYSSSPGVRGYHVYYGTASRTYTKMLDAGNLTNATISSLMAGTNYFFAVTAYNALGLESDFSSEIHFTPGLASLQLRMTPAEQAILTITGRKGHTYEIQAAQTFAAWTVIGVVTLLTSNSLDFTDVNAPKFARRFYRVRDTLP